MHKYGLLFVAVVTLNGCVMTDRTSNLPEQLVNQYHSLPDESVSDEFNTGKLDTSKWTYRKRESGGLGRGTEFVKFKKIDEHNQYVSLLGKGKQLKGSGISTLNAVEYGFYETRWKTTGISKDVVTSFHPAIWSYWGNSGEINKQISQEHTLEIDLMEFGNYPSPTHWSSDAPVFTNGTRVVSTGSKHESDIDFDGDKAVMIDAPNARRVDHDKWTTLGMEYTDKHLQMWEKIEGVWKKSGRTVYFTDKNTISSIDKKHRNKMYWLLSNLFIEFGGIPKDRRDTSLDVDYFRFYSVK